MTLDEEELAIRLRDQRWVRNHALVKETNASQAARDRRMLLARIDELRRQLEMVGVRLTWTQHQYSLLLKGERP